MSPEQIESIAVEALPDKVRAKRTQGHRLVQISATRLPGSVELTYSFDLEGKMTHLRLSLPGEAPRLPSVSAIYFCAVLYENEIHDLFNVQVDGMVVDFKGNFYQTAVKFPFGTLPEGKTPAPKPPPAAAAPAPAVLLSSRTPAQ